jgi:hypothetical protein
VRYRAGGHNLHDEAGRPKVWAPVMFWTEAIPSLVAKARHPWTRLLYAERNKTLVLGLSRRRFVVEGEPRYVFAHEGEALVTPGRGTLVVRAHERLSRKRRRRGEVPESWAFMLPHRINGSEPGHEPPPPYVPGEVEMRRAFYRTHFEDDAGIAEALLAEGRKVLAGGDFNRHGGNVFPHHLHFTERGKGADRVCASPGVTLGRMEWGEKYGSDHPSWSVEVTS